MSGQVFHFSPDLLNLLIDTIPRLCKSKKDVLIFFISAGANQNLLADINIKVQRDVNSINKYEIARTALVRLNDAGDVALRERREIIKRVVEFKDFSRCWPGDQLEATGLVAKVRELVNVQDTFTRLQNTYEFQQEEEKKKRQLEEYIRIEQLKQKRNTKQEIISELSALYQETDTQKRGKQLEGILNRLFESEGILVRESFTINGENNEGVIQQVDGAIEVNSHLYLVEMKWWKEKLSPRDVSQHMMRLYQRSDVRGIFISASGYTDAAVIDIQKALNQKIIVLFTVKDIVLLLAQEQSFECVLKSRVEAIQLQGKLLYDL